MESEASKSRYPIQRIVPCCGSRIADSCRSVCSQLQVIQLHRRRSAEKAHGHAHLAFVGQHFLDGTVEVREWSLGDRHRLTHEKRNLLLRLLLFRLVGDAE